MNNSACFITYSIFSPYNEVVAFTTSKDGWGIPNQRFTGDSGEIYRNSREKLAQGLGLPAGQLVFPRQEHTDQVVALDHIPETEIKGVDALVTATPGLCVCVQTADCVPILLFDPENRVVAAVHAGWRGTAGRIAAQTVWSMISGFGSDPGKILAAIGPSIGPGKYEVGQEVVDEMNKSIHADGKIFCPLGKGKFLLNLWEANRLILSEVGIAPQNIEIAGLCTYTESGRFYSARREGNTTGRMASGILIKKDEASFKIP